MARQVKPPKAKGNVRDAGSGRFTSAAKAKSDPKGTVTEKRASRAKKPCTNCAAKPGLEPGTDHKLCSVCNGTGKV